MTPIPDSGPGGANGRGFTVTGLAGLVEHTFELRARDADDATSRALTDAGNADGRCRGDAASER